MKATTLRLRRKEGHCLNLLKFLCATWKTWSPDWGQNSEPTTLSPLPWAHYPKPTTLRPLPWDHYSEPNTLRPLPWDHYSETTILRPLPWAQYPETTTLRPLPWDHYSETTILRPLPWDHYSETTTLRPRRRRGSHCLMLLRFHGRLILIVITKDWTLTLRQGDWAGEKVTA